MCGGDGYALGALGCLVWYRCESCGMQFSHKRRIRWRKPRKKTAA